MARDKLVIWGGNGQELSLETLDSHASVNAYFLSRHLSQYYEVVNLVDMDRPEDLLEHLDATAMLSTFQYGFTSRLVLRDRRDFFLDLRARFPGLLCSVVDLAQAQTYYEDILFTVLPPDASQTRAIARQSFNPNIVVTRMGWCAEPEQCFPEGLTGDEVNVFVDHPPYSADSPDCTREYFDSFRRVRQRNPQVKLRVWQQNNWGVVEWRDNSQLDEGLYIRSNKVPWTRMIEHYRRSHVFCVTHPESAGLAVIEAAMCGAKIYLPVDNFRRSFIPRSLVQDGIAVSRFRHRPGLGPAASRISRALEKDLERGWDRQGVHQKLASTNSWENAARNIHRELSRDRSGPRV